MDAPYMGFAGNKDSSFEAEGDAFSSLSAKKRKKAEKNVSKSAQLIAFCFADSM